MKNTEDAEEECPTCEKKFPNMAMLSDHFDEDHGSSDEEEKPEEHSSKGITISNTNSNNNNNNSILAQYEAIQNSERAKQLPKNTTVVVTQPLVKVRGQLSVISCQIGQLSVRTTVSADNCQIRQLSDRTTVSSDNCQIGQLSVGQLSVGHGQLSEETVSALIKL